MGEIPSAALDPRVSEDTCGGDSANFGLARELTVEFSPNLWSLLIRPVQGAGLARVTAYGHVTTGHCEGVDQGESHVLEYSQPKCPPVSI